MTTPSKAQGERLLETIRDKKRWGHFCQQTPSVENASSILPSPPATATKKHRIPNSKNFNISLGFSKFNVVGYWRRKYRGKVEDEGWYLLTNLSSSQQAIAAYKCRSGIEAMFKDCKTGGYNLAHSHANNDRSKNLILLIAIAYTIKKEFRIKEVQEFRMEDLRMRKRSLFSFFFFSFLLNSCRDVLPERLY